MKDILLSAKDGVLPIVVHHRTADKHIIVCLVGTAVGQRHGVGGTECQFQTGLWQQNDSAIVITAVYAGQREAAIQAQQAFLFGEREGIVIDIGREALG